LVWLRAPLTATSFAFGSSLLIPYFHIPSFLKIVLVLVVVLVLVLQALPVQRGSRSKETGAKHKRHFVPGY
jgi:hypothetical protein